MKCVVAFLACALALPLTLAADSVVVFNEVMYHPPSNETAFEWIELHNQNAVDVDLSGWALTGGVQYVFPEGTRIKGRGYLVVASDPGSLAGAGTPNALGPFAGRLGNGGEKIQIVDRTQRIMDTLNYGVDDTWPVAADGTGLSLAKRQPNLGSGSAESWTVSSQIGGTPGARNFPSGFYEAPEGLVSYWDFNESSGLVALDRQGNNPGTFNGNVERVPGLAGAGAIRFAGNGSGSIGVGRGSSNNLSVKAGFTLEAAVTPTWSGTGRATIFRKTGDHFGSLVSYWSFDESNVGTTPALDTVGGNTGTFKSITTRTNGLRGKGALLFKNGTTEGVSVGTGNGTSFSFTSGITLAAWIRPQWSGASNNYDVIFCKDDGEFRINFAFQNDSSNDLGLVSVPAGPVLSLGLNIGGTFGELDMPLDGNAGRPTLDQLKDGQPHLVAGTFDSSTGTVGIWVDGTLRYSTQKSGVLKTGGTATAYIGNRNATGNQSFTGVLDEMALWSSALSAEVMSQLAQGVNPLEVFPETSAGNRLQFGFRQAGDTDFTDPPVTTTPVLFIGSKIGANYSELELPLDGNEGRPSLSQLKDGHPHHVAAYYNGVQGERGIAIDGVILARQTITGNLDIGATGLTFLGNQSESGNERFQGTLDEVLFWGKGLRPQDLSQHARLLQAGLPFFATPPSDLPTLQISELPSSSTNPYWIELQNNGSASVDLTGLILVSSSGGLYVLPSRTLGAGEYAVFVQGDFGFRPKVGAVMSLYSKDRQGLIDAVRVQTSALARDNAAQGVWRVPAKGSPGSANVIELHDEIVINEIFYHAPPQYSEVAEFATDTLVPIESEWKYNAAGQDLGTDWTDPLYNDGSWSSGLALFYNETSPLPAAKNTPLDLGPLTYYFRKQFTLTQDPKNVQLALRTVVDDGAVVYLNGVEVYRFNLKGGIPITYTNLANSVGNAVLTAFTNLVVTNLIQGINTLAVEVHQSATNSDDVVFGLQLDARYQTKAAVPFVANSEQWVELYNRSSKTVELAGWKLDAGVVYAFDAATSLPPGGYLVVAADPNALRAKYPDIQIVGPWQGKLSSSGERVILKDPAGNVANQVHYKIDGDWPSAADEGGSSLELRDPLSDNANGGAWAASDESHKSKWQTIKYQGLGSQLFTTPSDAQYQELVIGLLDVGEVLLDDISVKDLTSNPSASIIQNGTFDTGLEKWRVIGNHEATWDVDPEDPSNHVMHMVATGMTEHLNNHAETTVKDGTKFITLNDKHQYEISLRAKWVSGSPQLNTRLFFNRLPKTTVLNIPDHWGTPGKQNSRSVPNLGPTFTEFRHDPPVPAPSQPVTIQVKATDPQGVASCTLWWATNGVNWNSQSMTLDSQGLYASSIPGFQAQRVVQFYVQATDTLGATNTYPAEGRNSRALYVVNDGAANLSLGHNLRLIMTASDTNRLMALTNRMSNGRIGCTMIYDEREIYYDLGIRLKGSEHGRAHDKENRLGFNLEFPSDHLFRGVQGTIALDRSGGGSRFGQDEILINHVVYHAGGVPAMHNDLGLIIGPTPFFNGSCILQMSRYSPVFLSEQYENGSSRPTFEMEFYYGESETIPSGPEGFKIPQEAGVTTTTLQDDNGDDKENYRLGFITKNARDRDDFESFIPIKKLFRLPPKTFADAADQNLDVEEWLRAFALAQLCGAGDNYSGSGSGHNLMLYVRPSDNKLIHLLWDMDFAFTQGDSSPLDSNTDLQSLLLKPANKHSYYGHILDIITTTYNTNYMAYWSDHYDNFTTGGQDFKPFLDYIRSRSAFARNALPKVVPFAITNNAGQTFLTNAPTGLLVGTAWVDVKQIRFAGSSDPAPVNWTGQVNWTVPVPLLLGSNTFYLNAYHLNGTLLTNTSITVIGTSPSGGIDTDGDGMPDAWENMHDLNPLIPDAQRDLDGDGLTNLQEYLAGTDPRSAQSRLRLNEVARVGKDTVIRFSAVTGRSYTIQYQDALGGSGWQTLTTVSPGLSDRAVETTDTAPTSATRFYRLSTP